MNAIFGSATLAAALAMATAATAAPLTCPVPAAVFAKTNGASRPVSIAGLADQVGTSALDDKGVRAMETKIASDYPDAKKAEIADLLITAFCTYLKKDTPGTRQREASVLAYEKLVYSVVFGGAPPSDYKRQGWLYGG